MKGYEKLDYMDKKIIMVYCTNNMNAANAAKEAVCHRTNIYYHLNKVKKKTGLNPLKFTDLIQLYTYIVEENKKAEKNKQQKRQLENKRFHDTIGLIL